MSTTITLQAALTGYLSGAAEGGRSVAVSIPSGTVLTITDAVDQDSVAEKLAAISPTALANNRSQLDRVIDPWPANTPPHTAGDAVQVTYGPHGEKKTTSFAVSSSVSSSTSSSASSSVSSSAS